jgi:hypothetical protein
MFVYLTLQVRSDDQTLHLLFGRMMGLTTSSSSNGQGDAAAVAAARQEAASAMASNMGGILGDVVDNCGLLRCGGAWLGGGGWRVAGSIWCGR